MTIFTILTYAMLLFIVGVAVTTGVRELVQRPSVAHKLVPSRRAARGRA